MILWSNSILWITFRSLGCCQVLLDKDVNGVKLVLDVCNAVLKKSEKFDIVLNKLDNKAFERCRSLINSTCSIDIQTLLKDKIRLDPNYKSTLEQLRTVNSSFCLKYHFDINLDVIGVPHRLKKPDFMSYSSKKELMNHAFLSKLTKSNLHSSSNSWFYKKSARST